MCNFGSCKTRFEFLSQFRKVRNAFQCFVTQVKTRLPKSKCVWPMKINVICTVHRKSECVPTVVPTLAAALQTASEVVQPRPRDYGCTDPLPPVGECLKSLGIDTPDAKASEIEVAGGIPPADMDIYVVPDVLRTAVSLTTVVSEKWMEIDTPDAMVSGMEVAGGSPPADMDICVVPDVLQTAVSVTTVVSEKSMEIDTRDAVESGMKVAGGSPPAAIDISGSPDVIPTAISVMTVVSGKSMEIDTPDAVVSGMEVAGGSPPADIDISVGPDVQQTAVSVTTGVSEEWMERFVINLDVLCSDGLASGDDPAGGSSDVGSDVCVVQDPIPTAVSMRTVVAEKWMDRFVLDLVECPSVSRTGAVARRFGPAVSEEHSPVVFAGGGGRLLMHTPWV